MKKLNIDITIALEECECENSRAHHPAVADDIRATIARLEEKDLGDCDPFSRGFRRGAVSAYADVLRLLEGVAHEQNDAG